MPKLTMLSSREGSPDGLRVQWYFEGKSYDVSDSLAAIFLKECWAKVEPCVGNDPACPCQDGDACHYTGPNAWPVLEVAATPPAHKQEYFPKKPRK